jgi:putative NIF3 family GTP cyclohydrolase 1 type 2
MKAIDILEHFLSRAPWIDRERTVDRVIIGDPDKEVARVLVTWMPSLAAVQAAADDRYDMLMCHEPTFYDHLDHRDAPERAAETEVGARKKDLIEEAGLVVMRNHDCWDRWPGIGIPFAWADFLGFGREPIAKAGRDYMHRYDIEPVSVHELARRIASRTAAIGEPFVQVVGNGDLVVSRVGVGTGCASDPRVFRSMGCDVSIVSDDGTAYWREIQQADDEGHPVIRVHHGTSEEPGMVTLTGCLNEHLPVSADHLPHVPVFRTVGANGTP